MEIYAFNETGKWIETDFAKAFPFLKEKGHVISIVGAGGKTTLMFCLGKLCAKWGMRVLISTTTHIFCPEDGTYADTMAQVKAQWGKQQYAVVGQPVENGKLAMLPGKELEGYIKEADIVFLEADGSKGMPMKVPAEQEPVLLDCSDIVIAVCGLGAIGKNLEEGCFRLEQAEALLNKERTQPITEEDVAKVLTSENGSRKLVNNRDYYMVLNQCDFEKNKEQAERIAAILRKQGCGKGGKQWNSLHILMKQEMQ
jgi:probable selenium-dependent hydroxylase accessory protein YqeC